MLAQFDAATLGENFGRLLTLFVPTLIGWGFSRTRSMPNDDRTVGGLNSFVLLAAFPALIAASVIDIDPEAVAGWGFWAVTPMVLLGGMGIAWASGTVGLGRVGGTTALILMFGNTAFIGIPYVEQMFGPEARGPAAVSVAIQVSIGVAMGPALLNRWSGAGAGAVAWKRLLSQPLFWSPFIGLAVRALPDTVSEVVRDAIAPLGACAAPTAMFVLGTYLARPASEREGTHRGGVIAGTIARLFVMPLMTLVICLALVGIDALSPEMAAIMVVLMACPAAVTTFPLAQNEGVQASTVATLIMVTGLASLVTLPLFVSLAESVW